MPGTHGENAGPGCPHAKLLTDDDSLEDRRLLGSITSENLQLCAGDEDFAGTNVKSLRRRIAVVDFDSRERNFADGFIDDDPGDADLIRHSLAINLQAES